MKVSRDAITFQDPAGLDVATVTPDKLADADDAAGLMLWAIFWQLQDLNQRTVESVVATKSLDEKMGQVLDRATAGAGAVDTSKIIADAMAQLKNIGFPLPNARPEG
jgi:hypothetical protein